MTVLKDKANVSIITSNKSTSTKMSEVCKKPIIKSCEPIHIDLKKYSSQKRLFSNGAKADKKIPEKKQVNFLITIVIYIYITCVIIKLESLI